MKVNINGREHTVQVTGNPSLLEVLREQLDLTGAKYGCGEGVCGACKVLVNGLPMPSCITSITSVQDKKVITVEGLEQDGELHKIQQVFMDVDAFQCGYCAPGMIIATVALIDKNPRPSDQEIKDAMQGNICRCCTYPQIVRAIQQAI